VLLALEDLSVRQACRNANGDDLKNIQAIHDKIAAEYDRIEAIDLFELDMAFHSSIAKASRNGMLYATYQSYLQRLWRVRFLSARQKRNRDRVVSHHLDILKALEARDEKAAKGAINQHLGALAADIRPVIEEELSPST
jgi:DNA-binding GntR family transcriptional regulator